MDEYEILKKIIQDCLWIDQKACTIYHKFSESTPNEALKLEWNERSHEEMLHIRFWKKALQLAERKHLPLIFKNPLEIKEKIGRTRATIEKMTSLFTQYDDYTEQLTLSFMLETCMLHPAFMMMFHDYSFLDSTIGENYEKHVVAFIEMAKKFNENLSMLYVNLFCENLYDLYLVTMDYLDNSLRDNLTGLYNRRGFVNYTRPLLSMAEENNLTGGIIIIDFDNFKSVNDRLGHLSGDIALQTEAAIINSCVRKSDVVGRYGGDEFIIFTESRNLNSLGNVCERIRKETEEASERLCGIAFTISLGAAIGKIASPLEKCLAEIIHNADQKLYEAKSRGKNQWVV